jgi:hypothetical protein
MPQHFFHNQPFEVRGDVSCLGCCVWWRVGAHDKLMWYLYIPHPRKTIPRLLGELARGWNGVIGTNRHPSVTSRFLRSKA